MVLPRSRSRSRSVMAAAPALAWRGAEATEPWHPTRGRPCSGCCEGWCGVDVLAPERAGRIIGSGEGIVIPPVELSDDAMAIWNRLAPDLIEKRVLTSWDVHEFANGCRMQALLNRALSDAESSPLISQGSNENMVLNPAIRAVTALEAALRSIWSRFGLTPGDRATLKVSDNNGQKTGAARFLT